MPARVASSAATMLTNLGPRSVFTASTGLKLPVIGLGTFLSTDESTLVKSLNAALELRYPLIDTAFLYDNEHIIGKVLKDWMDNGKLRREDIFITTKLPPQGIRVEHVKEFLEKQLKSLQLEYVDLYLIHHAVGYKYESTIMSGSEGLDLTTDHVAVWELDRLKFYGKCAKLQVPRTDERLTGDHTDGKTDVWMDRLMYGWTD
ncbi:hypothetical protein J6590_080381 [Homalodisca vitripennis]|nr:hypothetical protein J6590_080381 [Homalodisca vitripennis]